MKKTLFSGIQPSGNPTLGNYLGAIKNWLNLKDDYNCYFSIMDLHAITVEQDPKELYKNTLELLAIYLAVGLDPKKENIFIQSHVAEHAELSWVLNTISYMGQLSRMTQYKDKTKAGEDNNNAGLFTYPVLMAADIFLYDVDYVPVGDDQRQHIELARDLAERFNNRFGETFIVPEGIYAKEGKRIMSLQDPDKKMSKSDDNLNSYILLLEEDKDIVKKINRAVTDSVGIIAYNDDQAGLKNLLDIYSTVSGEAIDSIVNRYKGEGYGKFKKDLGELLVEELRPIREEYKRIIEDRAYLEEVYKMGADKARAKASQTLARVYEKIGFVAYK